MARRRLALGTLEATVLDVLWTRGASTIADIVAALPKERARHPNTIHTVLERMARRGLVRRERDGRTSVYSAAAGREQVGAEHLDLLRREIFGGSIADLVSALVGPGRARGKRAEEIRRLLEEIEEGERS